LVTSNNLCKCKYSARCCQETTSSSSSTTLLNSTAASSLALPPRVLVLRSCSSRGRKILFDSYHVTDDGEYTRQTDAKFLKETIAEFAFGAVSIATNHTVRFTKFTNSNQDGDSTKATQYLVWANVFLNRRSENNNNNSGNIHGNNLIVAKQQH